MNLYYFGFNLFEKNYNIYLRNNYLGDVSRIEYLLFPSTASSLLI
jgi:hypothetical protein